MELKLLTKDKLEGFEKYKYNSKDTSILSIYVMHPFWNWCIKFFPMWIAPNCLTFAGFLLTTLNFLLFTYYDFHFTSMSMVNPTPQIPRWVWGFTSLSLFIAYTLDGIDGKQARRTGTSGPLGELFDHGLDSYSAVLIPTCLYSIFGRDEITPLRMFFVLWNIFVNFYLTHWEKYNTGIMFLPWGYDFTMLGSVLLLFVSALFGPKAWHIALPGGVSPGAVFEIVLYSSAMLTSQTVIIWNIYKSYRDKTGKMLSFKEAVRPLIPLTLFFALSTIWAYKSPNNVIEIAPRMFYLLTGTIFSNISCRLIVAQMSNTRCNAFNDLLIPFAIVVVFCLACNISAWMEVTLLHGLTFYASFAHISYGTLVVREMCAHFHIDCFHIRPKNNN